MSESERGKKERLVQYNIPYYLKRMYTDEEEEDYVLIFTYISKQIFTLLLQFVFSLPLKQTSPHIQVLFSHIYCLNGEKKRTKETKFIACELAKKHSSKKSNSPSHLKCNLCTIPTEIRESPICVRWWVERRGQHGL